MRKRPGIGSVLGTWTALAVGGVSGHARQEPPPIVAPASVDDVLEKEIHENLAIAIANARKLAEEERRSIFPLSEKTLTRERPDFITLLALSKDRLETGRNDPRIAESVKNYIEHRLLKGMLPDDAALAERIEREIEAPTQAAVAALAKKVEAQKAQPEYNQITARAWAMDALDTVAYLEIAHAAEVEFPAPGGAALERQLENLVGYIENGRMEEAQKLLLSLRKEAGLPCVKPEFPDSIAGAHIEQLGVFLDVTAVFLAHELKREKSEPLKSLPEPMVSPEQRQLQYTIYGVEKAIKDLMDRQLLEFDTLIPSRSDISNIPDSEKKQNEAVFLAALRQAMRALDEGNYEKANESLGFMMGFKLSLNTTRIGMEEAEAAADKCQREIVVPIYGLNGALKRMLGLEETHRQR